jgi:hypothetical protein
MRKRRRREEEEEESLLVCSSSGTSQISSTLVCFIRDGQVDRMFIPNLSVFHFLPVSSKQAGRQAGRQADRQQKQRLSLYSTKEALLL